MKLLKAMIITGFGCDRVSLITDLPSGTPAIDSSTLNLNFQVAEGGGAAYLKQHFPELPVETVSRHLGLLP